MAKKLNEAFGTAQVSVTSTASKIASGQAGVDTTLLYNSGSTTVYVGNSANVTASNGFPIPAGGSLTMETTSDIYGITSSGTGSISILVEQ